MAELNQTPSGMRIHIGFFGKTNSGKSTLINALAGQEVSIVSPEPGTTTDPVYKAMEIAPIGPCMLIDTAGLMDETTLGEVRREKTEKVAEVCDVAVIVSEEDEPVGMQGLIDVFNRNHTTIIYACGQKRDDIDSIRKDIIEAARKVSEPDLLRGMVSPGDLVMLVMPQDKQAPKGRLILPQVTTLRSLLDVHARTICVTPEEMESALEELKSPPKLIITDSQVFDYVFKRTPEKSKLTSFSVLYAGLKGDVSVYTRGAEAMEQLKPGDTVLVAESCTHAPMEEDIGREKIPAMLRKQVGGDIFVEIVAGKDFPEDLTKYNMILQCGGCMANRRQIMNRIRMAEEQGVPITNYGIAIAWLKGILGKIER